MIYRHYESFKRDLTQQNERVGGKCLVGIPNPPFLYSVPQKTVFFFFKFRVMHVHPRAYGCIISNEKKKGKFPGEHMRSLNWENKTYKIKLKVVLCSTISELEFKYTINSHSLKSLINNGPVCVCVCGGGGGCKHTRRSSLPTGVSRPLT